MEVTWNTMMKYVRCEICGSDDAKTLYEKTIVIHAAGPIVQCQKCGLVYVNPREFERQWFNLPKPEAVDPYLELIEGRMPIYRNRLNRIEKYKKGGRLLEIGCCIGTFLNLAKQRRWECYGVEPSFMISEYAKKSYGIDVFPGFLSEAHFHADYFDVVVIFHVLEHLSSPRKELEEVRRILKPSGLLVIEVPNIEHPLHRLIKRRQLFFVPGHFYYFSPQTLLQLLKREKFEMISIEPSYKAIDIRRICQILRKCGIQVGKLGNLIMHKWKIASFSIKVRTNLNILVMAKPAKK